MHGTTPGSERGGEERASGTGGCLAVEGQGFRFLFFFNLNTSSTLKYGKMTLISLLIFFSGD